MSKDDELHHGSSGGEEFSLEEILAEFSSNYMPPSELTGRASRAEPPAPKAEKGPKGDWKGGDTIPFPVKGRERNWAEDTIPFPVRPKGEPAPPPAGKETGRITLFPGPAPESEEPEEDEAPAEEVQAEQAPAQAEDEETKVLEFPPAEAMDPVSAGLDKLRRKADEFAGHMYEEAGRESDAATRQAEALIPGVDEEEEAPPPPKAKRRARPAPDLPPAELSKRYARGLKSRRLRVRLVFVLFLAALYLTLAETAPLPIPTVLAANAAWRCWTLAAIQGLAMLLGIDSVLRALIRPFQLRMGLETIVVLGAAATLADAIALPLLSGEGAVMARQPYCAASVLGLFCVMWGELFKRRGSRLACRTAASASEPYLVTRDEGAWNGKDTYAKSSGAPLGFGSQMQGLDGTERICRVAAPVVLAACLVSALVSSLGLGRPQDLLWCLSATLTAAGSLSATLCFGKPWRKLCARLAKSGAALAGWEGVTNTTGAANLLLYDADLFPPGSVALNGFKIFEGAPEKVIACAATVIRDSGSGLEKVFHDLLRSQGAVYRKGTDLVAFEGGGVSEIIRGEQVLVGSAAFMTLMDVSLPPGLNVKSAVFCAIGGHLAGIFALKYHLSQAVPLALDSLIRNKIVPVLCTRDFNLIPSMLRSRFKLPADRMEFPSVERRRELSDPAREHSDTLTAVLCREGIAPYAEAVVGGRRLRSAVRLSTTVACLGSVVGALLASYLTFMAAYASLTPVNLLIFLVMWLVPTFLISGWVDRY